MAKADTKAEVVGPGWVDQSVNRIRGFFPLAVERFLNQSIATFAPSVTTVTNVARSYALHALVMSDSVQRGLTEEETRILLRRAEVVVALASIAHAHSPNHPRWMPAPHGNDKLVAAWERGPLSMDDAVGTGADTYAQDSWGFLNPYVGSEMRLGILASTWLAPGAGYVDSKVRPDLEEALRLARDWSHVTREQAADASNLCICHSRDSADGAWLATRLAGDASRPGTVAGTIAATTTVVAKALTHAAIDSERDLAHFLSFSPLLAEDASLALSPVAHRWRGLTLRHTAVVAWRELWASMSQQAHLAGAFVPVYELQDWLADIAPAQSVGEFVEGLPATMEGGLPVDAEGACAQNGLAGPLLALARIMLAGRRASELSGEEQWGYLGELGDPDRAQELSPLWVRHTVDRWHDQPMADFCRFLVKVLLDRSQRVALDKAGFRRGRFVLPARVLIGDGFVEWRDAEGAGYPPLRLERLVHIGSQVGLFDRDDQGLWVLGSRGDLIAN